MATLYYRPYTSDPITDGELPAEAAGPAASMPTYAYAYPAAGTARRQQPQAQQTQAAGAGSVIPKLRGPGADYVAQLDGQLGEIEKYKDALRKMGQDVLALRDRVRELEFENSALRRDLANYADTAKILNDSVELDGIPKVELLSRYLALKRRLASTKSQLGDYRDRVHRLQNELIGQNQADGGDARKLAGAHQSQQQLLQQLQDRVSKLRRLEETCARQEREIERMERQLQRQAQHRDQREESQAAALMEENRRLREEAARLRQAERQPTGMENSERLELYQLLDKAETRIASLEKQVDQTARKQRREKEQLQQEIEEAERQSQRRQPSQQRQRRRPRRRQQPGNVHFVAVPVPYDFNRDRQADSFSDDDNDKDYDDEPQSRRRDRR